MALAASSILSTTIVGLVLLAIVVLIIRGLVKEKKSGGACSGCSGCGCNTQCPSKNPDQEKL